MSFSKNIPADVSFSEQEVELYQFFLPCFGVWFKLTLVEVGFIELLSKVIELGSFLIRLINTSHMGAPNTQSTRLTQNMLGCHLH